ncbi:probable ubiquitin-like-specific protease 2A isoform X2 [Coffea eugenioides]|uniref:probable ubiquitin-like-specific protease 2A isoform X2 n=1 Tax=Coffea eugenioides TaxID=49369 RepID=UPI000F60F101|nr:probable ubiquitin-like-specific protease 2A isoform X2 [Coffea eugenioides]
MVKPSKSSSNKSNNNSINKNKLSVYDFDCEDHQVEKDSQKILSKFKTKIPNFNQNKFSYSPVDKYCFLRSFTQGTKTIEENFEIKPVDIDSCFDAMGERICKVDTSVSGRSDYQLLVHSKCAFPGERYCTWKDRKPGNIPLFVDSEDEQGSDEVLRNEPICLDSDDDLGNKCVSSISSSDSAGDEGSCEEQPLNHGSTAVDSEAAVIVKPDCIIWGHMHSTTSQLTFSSRSIKLEGSTLFGTKRSFHFNWSINDLVKISSLWCREVETAILDLYLKCEDEKAAEIDSRFSGIVKLKFAVNDPQWSEKQQTIESLDVIYKASWCTVVDIDPLQNEFPCLEQKSMSFSRDCFPNDFFEDIIYPQGDPDAVLISKKDIDLLQPATFINDTIIDFYVKYLEQKIEPEEKHRFHFFNSFFFRKLADLDKDRSTACEGRAAFQRVRKWTRKVNLFEKDYLFIPVNFSLHWSLIVVCHPGEAAYYKGEVVDKSSKVPCILHMDSIRGIHRGLKNLFQTYLLEEWRERHVELSEEVPTNFLNLPFISLKQENSFDCGLFLLYYVERFLQQAPVNFNPYTEASNFLNKEWFHPAEASSRRDYIKKLIYKVSNDNAHKNSAVANEPQYSSHYMVEGEVSDESLLETCDGKEACRGGYSAPHADEETHETSQAANPMEYLQPLGRPNFIPGDILGEGHTAGSVAKQTHQFHGKSEPHDQTCNNMSPIEEEEAPWEQTASVDTVGGRQAVASVKQIPMHLDYEDVEILDVKSLNSLEMQDEEAVVPRVLHVLDSEARDKKNDTSSMSREELDCCVVEDSVEENGRFDTNDNENPLSCEATTVAFYDLEVESPSNTNIKANPSKPVAASEEERDIESVNILTSSYRRRGRFLSKYSHC